MDHHSTGALSEEQRQAQNEQYAQKHDYDYVVIGTGMSALSAAALLAKRGARICMLEAHDVPGGYAHTFKMNDFEFCAEIHYIWGCSPGQRIYEFLRKLGLEEDITFNAYNPDCYDRVRLPDGQFVSIPYGFEKLTDNIEATYPGNRKSLEHFFASINALRDEMNRLPPTVNWWTCLTQGYKFPKLFFARNKTLQDFYNASKLSKEAQAILNANGGDFMCSPEELSIFAYIGLMCGYNEGAYYPKKHFKYFVQRLADFITSHPGCHIYYETHVNKINTEGENVVSLETSCGKTFKGAHYLCNMDPQSAVKLAHSPIPKKQQKALNYKYSRSALTMYLGIKDIDMRDFGFGNFNTWHLENWDLNQIWRDFDHHIFEKPMLFLSTPTLHTAENGTHPPGRQILELTTCANWEVFHRLYSEDPASYRKEKKKLENLCLDIVDKYYIPDIRKYLALKVVGSPKTNETFCYAPYGNSYGSHMSPDQMGLSRLKSQSPWSNLSWCNASSGFSGVYGTIYTGSELYSTLTNDRFFDNCKHPNTEEAIAWAKAHAYTP